MSVLINIYWHNQMPKGRRDLLEMRDHVVLPQTRQLLKTMPNTPPANTTNGALRDIHNILWEGRNNPWVNRVERLHQQYKAGNLKNMKQEALQLLAILFPAEERKAKLDSKQSESLFKALIAITLHLIQAELEASAA